MALDLIIVFSVGLFALRGYGHGFRRGLSSFLSLVFCVWLALRKYSAVTPLFDDIVRNPRVAAFLAFALVFIGAWLALGWARKMLPKLVDWSRILDLDQFLGGVFGLAKGMALVWCLLAICLSVFPSSVRLVERSNASMRLLSLGERLAPTPADLNARQSISRVRYDNPVEAVASRRASSLRSHGN
jgi:uncharacterized membrane protein required for colicin V production